MSKPVISVENISKSYQLGVINTGTFYGDVQKWWARLRGQPDPHLKIGEKDYGNREGETVWALKDINFTAYEGEAVGVIGRNGAGKSTLLKILSQVTAPTSGIVNVRGRIVSLLEVGTGFHPELTGRENVYLNGAIMGMSRVEVSRKLEEIVDFSGVGNFIDTPVKRYSSGMYVRLAFAVAAHLDSEILIVDEVLAVGDAEFQKKCLGKMENVSRLQGRTVLFVSHNMAAIKKLCNRGILLEEGIKKLEGEINTVTDKYTNPPSENSFVPFRISGIDIVVTKINVITDNTRQILPLKPMVVEIEIDAEYDIDTIGFEVTISNDDTNGIVFRTNTFAIKNMDIKIKKGMNKISCLIDSFDLASGKYWLGFGVSLLLIKYYYFESALFTFDVSEALIENSTLTTTSSYSHVYLKHKWVVEN